MILYYKMKTRHKQLLKQNKELLESLRNRQLLTLNETKAEKEARIKELIGDYTKFIEYYFPKIVKPGTVAWFHKEIAKRIVENDMCRLNVQMGRSFAKTTTVNLFIPIWLLVQNKISFMVVAASSEDNAKLILGKIAHQLTTNPRLIHDFGSFFKRSVVSQNEFTTKAGVKFLAVGRGQNPRGLSNLESQRPDYITVDDIDDDTIVRNNQRSADLYRWVMTALLGCFFLDKGRFIAVQNLFHPNCLTNKLETDAGFKPLKINALNSKGESNWPEVITTEQVLTIKKTRGTRYFLQEYMNTPTTEGSVFKREWLMFTKVPEYKDFDMVVLYTDPSASVKGDFKAIAIVGLLNKKYYILDLFVRKTSIKTMLDFIEQKYHEFTEMQLYTEANFGQGILLELELKHRDSVLPLRMDKRVKKNKQMRIQNLDTLFERKLILINEDLKEQEDYKEFETQLLGFELGNTKLHDDAPDALEGAINMLAVNSRYTGEIHLFEPRSRVSI